MMTNANQFLESFFKETLPLIVMKYIQTIYSDQFNTILHTYKTYSDHAFFSKQVHKQLQIRRIL